MDQNRTTAGGDAASDEPSLTQKNSETVRGEEILADDTGEAESNLTGGASTRTKLGAIQPAYGAAGGTTDATEEGGDGT